MATLSLLGVVFLVLCMVLAIVGAIYAFFHEIDNEEVLSMIFLFAMSILMAAVSAVLLFTVH